jgi:hypothetical protein
MEQDFGSNRVTIVNFHTGITRLAWGNQDGEVDRSQNAVHNDDGSKWMSTAGGGKL